MTDLPGHDRKLTSDEKLIFTSHQKYIDGNRDYCSHFLLIFETTGKFLIVFMKLIQEKIGVDVVTDLRREIDIRHEFDLMVVLEKLGCK